MPSIEMQPDERAPVVESGETRESNHRIANNLALVGALVRMQAGAISRKAAPLGAEEAAGALLEAAARIDNVAKLHRLLSNTGGEALTAGAYLQDICAGVAGSLSHSDYVSYKDESGSARLSPERLTALGLFVTEALTNAFKHAHPAGAPGEIVVAFRRNGHQLQLDVADDGVGFPEHFKPEIDGGLGFRIMRSLAGQMQAALSFPQNAFGATIRLDLPVAIALKAQTA